MKRILLDINVVLDVLLDRKPHAGASIKVWGAVETGKVEGLLAAHEITTIFYLVGRERGVGAARRATAAILQVFGVAAVDGDVIRRAVQLAWPDFEDAVAAMAADAAGCDGIITRDRRGFPESPVRVYTPEAAAAVLSKS
jgi:predicted nucleic acid-binding protein